ncbi:putative ribonuclease H-like domain-containing protein [Tanacetum coccineum]
MNRFKKVEGYHAVPPPCIGNYMPSRPDLSFAGLDDFVYKTNVSETISNVPRIESTASKSSKDSLEQPKDVRPSASYLEELSKTLMVEFVKKKEDGICRRPEGVKLLEKKNSVLFTKTECLVLSPDFKLLDESQVLLKVPRQNNMYSFDLKNVVPSGDNKDADEVPGKGDDDLSERDGQKRKKELQIKKMTSIVSAVNPSVSAAGQGFDNDDDQERIDSSTQDVNIVGPSINTASENINTGNSNINTASPIPNDPSMQSLKATGIFDDAYDDREKVGAKADLNNLVTTINVSSIPKTRIHKDHPIEQIISNLHSALLTRRMSQQNLEELGLNPKRIEAIRLFLAYASFMGFIVYQMDVKSVLLYGTIEEEVYVCQPPSFEDPQFPDKVFRRGTIDKSLFIKKDKSDILLVQVYVDDIIFGSTKKSLYDEFEGLMHKRFQMSSMGELTFFLGLQVQQKEDGIFISQDKYVAEILKKFDFATVKTSSTPIETNKALVKDEEAKVVDVHLYRSMIGSLMYLTASRPGIMFAVCACARDLPFDLEAFFDSDYVGASLDRKSTTGGCQFLRRRLISWQCKKQTIVSNSTTEAEYVAAAN